MNYRDWHVGMRVVCVDDNYGYFPPTDVASREVRPVKGCVYMIRALDISPCPLGLSVRLVEIINVPRLYLDGRAEVSFRADRFRPVQPRKTDISIFTAMLNGAKERERA